MKHNALIYHNTFKNVNIINLKTVFYHSYLHETPLWLFSLCDFLNKLFRSKFPSYSTSGHLTEHLLGLSLSSSIKALAYYENRPVPV